MTPRDIGMMYDADIREIVGDGELKDSARIVRNSFRTIALEFGLTRENCPTHPSFITVRQLRRLKEKGLIFFGLFLHEVQVGLVAVEKAEESLYYMEKLAVLPAYRHKGYGKALVKHALDYAQRAGADKVSIGIINEQDILKDWYRGIGFIQTGTSTFAHLPFTVCFMEKLVR